MTFYAVYDAVRHIPHGLVASYGQIAAMVGAPKSARMIGFALSRCPHDDVPCHRVVSKQGGLCSGFEPLGIVTHKMLLEMEGVEFTCCGTVDMERYSWKP